MSTSTRSVRRLRLAAQRIEGSDRTDPAQVVQWMLAMQGQDLPGALWSVGLRAPGSTLADVHAALDRAEIIRSWPMRGTLHLVAAQDIRWMLAVTADRTLRSLTRRHRELEIDRAVADRAADVAQSVLEGGRALTRSALFDAFAAAGIGVAGQRGPHLLGLLHQTGQLCLGPMVGGEQAVVLLDDWAPRGQMFERDEALGEFVRRYFLSHGPATLRDFSWWTKLPLRDAGVGLEIARHHLEELVIDGTSYFMDPGLPDRDRRAVRLMPGFDELLLGYQDRSASLAAEHAPAIVPGNNGMFRPTIVVDGTVVGTWRRSRTAAGITLTPLPFAPLSRRDTAGLAGAAAAYGRFMGRDVVLG